MQFESRHRPRPVRVAADGDRVARSGGRGKSGDENSNLTQDHNTYERAVAFRGRDLTVPVKKGPFWCTMAALAIRVGRVSRGTNRTAGQKVYDHTAGRAGVAYCRAGYATAAP